MIQKIQNKNTLLYCTDFFLKTPIGCDAMIQDLNYLHQLDTHLL